MAVLAAVLPAEVLTVEVVPITPGRAAGKAWSQPADDGRTAVTVTTSAATSPSAMPFGFGTDRVVPDATGDPAPERVSSRRCAAGSSTKRPAATGPSAGSNHPRTSTTRCPTAVV